MTESAKSERIGVFVIHGVGDAEPGWINDYVLPNLAGKMPPLAFENHSEVYKLPDRGRTRQGTFFPAHISRGHLGENQQVVLAELYWADLSKVGQGPIYYVLAALRLFFEAPSILAKGFLEDAQGVFHGMLRWFTVCATWLLRWPIAGMNVTTVLCAWSLIGLNQFSFADKIPLAITLMSLLAVIALAGLIMARARLYKDIWLTDVALATSITAALAFVAVGVLNLLLPAREIARPIDYLALAMPSILRIWVVWSVVIAIAIGMLTLLYIKRGLGFRPKQYFPAARPSAALGLALLQGLIWKVAVTLPSISIIQSLDRIQPNAYDRAVGALKPLWPFLGQTAPCVKAQIEPFLTVCSWISPSTTTVIKDAIARLNGVFVFNSLNAMYAFGAFILLIMLRHAIARFPFGKLETKCRFMPRMIVSQLVIACLFVGSLANLVIYEQGLYESKFIAEAIPGIRAIWIVPGLISAGVVLLYVFGIFQSVTANVIHIFRDIVDHQYRPQFDALKVMLPKGAVRKDNPYPRRERIQARMNVLIEEFVARGSFDQIIFLAHSQGSVILYEYLKSTDDNTAFNNIKRIDVVTLGSPLTHLYQYYFDEYGRQKPPASSLHPQLKTWTNLWRVDDPIGNRVDIVAGNFVTNEVLGPGGHQNYWREARVRQVLMGLAGYPSAVATDGASTAQPEARPSTDALGVPAE